MPEHVKDTITPAGTVQKTARRCTVCGFVFNGEKPPKGLPCLPQPVVRIYSGEGLCTASL